MTLKLPKRYQQTKDKFSGGMGDVFICDDTNLNRKVAIKLIKGSTESKRMLDEISAYEGLRSDHVVEIFDIIKFKDSSYGIVQDFIPGKDLLEFSGSTSLSSEHYLKILYQIACGLTDIHGIGRIHRDIKPNNIKFDQEGLLKIFDFGLSRTDGKDSKTVGFRGTMGFAAPELYSKGVVDFSQPIDVYAFGATAYYVSNETLPKDWLKVPPKIDSSKNYFSDLIIPGVPSDVLEILNLCLSENPDDRPKIKDVLDIIARYLLYDKHKATLCWQGNRYFLDRKNRELGVKRDDIGKIKIGYDGLCFRVTKIDGEVFINNDSIKAGDILPDSCVVTIGDVHRKANRTYITFDMSHPEVVL